MRPDFIYLAWGRPQRPRANLIQTLHTVDALTAAIGKVRLYLPPLPPRFDLAGFLGHMGVRQPIDVRGAPSLHRRWRGWPFVLLHRRELMAAKTVYTRVPELSLVLARCDIPHWLEVHEPTTLAARGHLARLLDGLRRGVLRGLVAISDAGRTELVAAGAPESRVHVLPSGVDLDAFSSIPSLEPADLAAPQAIYVGRISCDRGLRILEAVAAAGHPVTLVGPCDDRPAHALPTLTLEKPVPHGDVPAQLARGALALMPYQANLRHALAISPIKLFEAMAAGRVVIASDLPPIREVVRDGENGLLVPPDDPSAWVAAVERVRADPASAVVMAEAARATASSFGWESRARKLLALCSASVPRR